MSDEQKIKLWMEAAGASLKRGRIQDFFTALWSACQVPVPSTWPNGEPLYREGE